MAGKLMQALSYDSYGGGSAGLKHVEISVPAPKNGEILIKIEAASINPVDWKIQKGVARPFLPKKFPYVPVTDVAGEVVEVGSGVEKFKVGDKVVTFLIHNSYTIEMGKQTTKSRKPDKVIGKGKVTPDKVTEIVRNV